MVFDKKTYARAYYLKNREKFLADRAAYVASNLDEIKATHKKYYLENRSALRAQQAKYYKDNANTILKRNKVWRTENKELIAAYQEKVAARKAKTDAARHLRNREKNLARMAAWGTENAAKARTRKAKDRAMKKRACPPWADLNAIEAVYHLARKLEQETGEPYHVDHIVPLKGKNVCGLHIAINLRPLPAIENMMKKNTFIEELAFASNDTCGPNQASP